MVKKKNMFLPKDNYQMSLYAPRNVLVKFVS